MVYFVFMYDVVPGKAAEAAQWARENWIPWWKAQPSVRSYHVLGSFFGSVPGPGVGFPQRMVMVGMDSLADLEEILSSDEAGRLLKDLHNYAMHVQTYILRQLYEHTRED